MNLLSLSRIIGPGVALSLFAACGAGNKETRESLPDNFDSMADTAKVEFVMKNATPDSVARFLCEASLGHVEGAHIDTLAIAAAYAYEHYNDSDLIVFSQEFDDYSANLPLDDKMRIYSMAGTSDPQRLGYELGLEYVSHIRENRMTVADIKKELQAFKTACANDSDTYTRFIKGFRTVLKVDHGKDLSEDIYNAFIDFQ